MRGAQVDKLLYAAVIVFALNGYFITSTLANEDDPRADETHIRNMHNTHDESSMNSLIQDKDLPKFGENLQNVTIPVGREAVLQCVVDNLQTYKIAWLRVDTQTILTIQSHVITKNHRITITHAEKRAWILKIKDVKESDKGWYMCQINTDPMKSQVGYLNVVVPPDILDYSTSTDMVVREGSNVALKCAAVGSPTPTITWRREGGEPITAVDGNEVSSYNGSILSISRVNRLHMGPYLCIASNGIPPTVSKRIMLRVHFPPMIWIQNQLVGAALNQPVTLECQSEAFPKSINYWMRNDTIIVQDDRFSPETYEMAYRVVMKLTILTVDITDFGSYKCVAKNSLGDTDGGIKLYHIPHTTVMSIETPMATMSTVILKTQSTHLIKDYKRTTQKPFVEVITAVTNIPTFGMPTTDRSNKNGHDQDVDGRLWGESTNTQLQGDADTYSSGDSHETSLTSKSADIMLQAASGASTRESTGVNYVTSIILMQFSLLLIFT